jgi:carboxypeptidase Q
MQNTFHDGPAVFNIIAEIPGTDPGTDPRIGNEVVMEAMRILRALELRPRRTIRLALSTGEEQGALGSKAYVAQHYRDETGNSVTNKQEYDTFSVYFNLDGGTGRIRGIFEAGKMLPTVFFQAWMAPFNDLGMTTVSPWDIGGGDDNSFRRVGLPSFGFIQDPIEYGSRTYQSSDGVFERIQPEDVKFNATVMAALVWQAAQCQEKFPR